ncbi:MAG: ArsR/SmtB family transcription factor [Candidatus Sumerlaeaceae bacterium]|jgi:ArsR family transcriptional regulator
MNKTATRKNLKELPQFSMRHRLRAHILKALAHPVRWYFVEVLAHGPQCVCDLQHLVNLDMSTVSKHLAVLKQAGIVWDEKRGTQVLYHLATPCVLNVIPCVEGVLVADIKQKMEAMKSDE